MSLTNIALNSRSLNGVITISDGTAVLEDGDLTCEDINSNSLTTNQINTTLLTVTGKIECNTNGPYNIPTSISSVTGLLIGYGNVTNSGATDFLNFGSTYTSTQQGFRFWNKSAIQTLTNLAIIDNTQTFFSSQLTNCTAESPLNANSVANKSYVDTNFMFKTGSVTESINGLKTFTNNLTCSASLLSDNLTAINLTANKSIYTTMTAGTINLGSSSNTINCAGTINGTIVQSSNFRGANSTSGVNICGNAQNADITLASSLGIAGTLTIGSANGQNTIRGQTNFTGTLLSKTNYKMNEYENSPTSNSITLTFPMAQTIALRTTPGTANPMIVTLPTLTNNERGMVFTFNKLFDTQNNLNFPVTFNTSSSQGIYTLLDQTGTPTSNTSFLSVDKIQVKLAVGWFSTFLYWIEQTDYSTFDRFKLREWINPANANTLTLSFPMPPVIALRVLSGTTMTVTLPTLSASERGQIFTFVKTSTNFNVTFNTSGGNAIYALNNLTGTPTTNSTIFPDNKRTCKIAVGWFGTSTYWIEIGSYSTLDVDTNNGRYVDFSTEQFITGTKKFKDISWIDVASPFTNRVQSYVNQDALIFTPVFNLNKYAFVTKNSLGSPINAILITNATTSIGNNLSVTGQATFTSSLISNNITSPVALGGTNNIYTNLDTSTGGAIINIGARSNNINILCNLNIVESVYGVTPNKITTINQEGDSCRFTNNGSTNGNFIFQINESGSFVPLVVNKTSVDIGGDAVVGGNLYLNDTTPLSTLSMSVGVISNDMTFDPENTTNTTYKFKVTDGSSPIPITSTALTISSALTTINTPTTITELLTCKNLELSYTGNAHINAPNATGLNLFLSLTTQTIGLFSNLTTAIVNFCSSSVFTTIFNINSRIKHKQFQYINEVKHITGTSETLTIPLEQTIMLSAAGSSSIAITLPLLDASHQLGFTFNLIKTGSLTNSVTFTAQGSNKIREYGSITGFSSLTQMSGTSTIINIFTLEVSTGNFVWQIY